MSHKNNSYNMESFTTAFLQLFPVRRKENVKIIQNIPPLCNGFAYSKNNSHV
jgi:hypothetical protein